MGTQGAPAARRAMIEWAVASMPLAGQKRSGDLCVVEPFADGTLVGVIDGAGHGEEARKAADTAATILKAHSSDSVDSLMRRCHEGLLGGRGAAMTLVSISASDHTLSCLGVGNVEGVLLRRCPGSRKREGIVQRGGVVGFRLPPLHTTKMDCGRDDLLVLATDGIRPGFVNDLLSEASTQQMADDILTRFARGSDDALVLLVRVGDGAP